MPLPAHGDGVPRCILGAQEQRALLMAMSVSVALDVGVVSERPSPSVLKGRRKGMDPCPSVPSKKEPNCWLVLVQLYL